MKRCFKCGVEKPLDDFYRHSMMADGYLGKCVECAKRDMRLHRLAHPDVVRLTDQLKYRRRREAHLARAREYGRLHPESMRRSRLKNEEQHPERKRAATMVGNAVRDRRLIKPVTCDFCHQVTKVEAHHWDYGQPLVVSWLCDGCHRIADHARREAEARINRQRSA